MANWPNNAPAHSYNSSQLSTSQAASLLKMLYSWGYKPIISSLTTILQRKRFDVVDTREHNAPEQPYIYKMTGMV
jgi:hypothetical protein